MKEEKPEAQPVVPAAAGQPFAAIPTAWGAPAGLNQYLTSIDGKSAAGRAMLLAALNDEAENAAEFVNTEFEAVHVTCHPAEKVQEDGETLVLPRTILTLKDGRRLHFISAGVLKSLYLIMQHYSQPPWAKGLRMKLTRKITGKNADGSNRSMYNLSVVEKGGG